MEETPFSTWLRDQLLAHNLQPSDFAARAGISHQNVSRWLAGAIPSGRMIAIIARTLAVDVETVVRAIGAEDTMGLTVEDHLRAALAGLPLMVRADDGTPVYLPPDHRGGRRRYRAIRVVGESDDFRAGDIAVAEQGAVPPGQWAITEGGAVVRAGKGVDVWGRVVYVVRELDR